MKNSDFITLLIANTNKSHHIRTYSKHWPSGARRIPDGTLYRIGGIISLLDHRLSEGMIAPGCKNGTEALLLYNIQPMIIHQGHQLCSLDFLVKPRSKINDTDTLEGQPLQLIFDIATTEVMNNTQGLMLLGLVTQQDLREDEDMPSPQSYGFFSQFTAITSFMAIASDKDLDLTAIFNGRHDLEYCIIHGPAYDCFLEASEFNKNSHKPFQLVAELKGPKEELRNMKLKGLSTSIAKIIDFNQSCVMVTDNPVVHPEDKVEDEVARLKEALSEPPPKKEELFTDSNKV
eukprot:TRINITY_DN11346_c0_g1_i2.p1 TRINITY_DN11346_c0_g1~~TRINITY_DN11346_c0_g1_i2.p1  ORF type:complete len:289 (-),score=20.09 TRINITY_DN11346_c0_g1_i2:132-998(-)